MSEIKRNQLVTDQLATELQSVVYIQETKCVDGFDEICMGY